MQFWTEIPQVHEDILASITDYAFKDPTERQIRGVGPGHLRGFSLSH